MGFALYYENTVAIIAIGIIGVISDGLDGYFARKFNQVTELGKIIDPVADKMLVGIIAMFLIIQGKMPLWLGIAILTRDAIILTGGLYAKNKLKFVIPSNYVGKFTVDIIALFLLGTVLNIRFVINYGPYVALSAMILSLIVYGFNMLKKLKEKN